MAEPRILWFPRGMINCHLVDRFSAPLSTIAKVKLLAVPRVGETLAVKMQDDQYRRFTIKAVGYQCEDVSHRAIALNAPVESFVLLQVDDAR